MTEPAFSRGVVKMSSPIQIVRMSRLSVARKPNTLGTTVDRNWFCEEQSVLVILFFGEVSTGAFSLIPSKEKSISPD